MAGPMSATTLRRGPSLLEGWESVKVGRVLEGKRRTTFRGKSDSKDLLQSL
jgi:hypothetical protein